MGGFGGQRNRVPVLFLFVFGVEVFAGIAMGAIGASVVSITDAIFRRQLVAVLGLGDRLDCVVREHFEFAIDVLRGDPKARQEEACAAGVQFRGAERAENPGEGNLYGAAIFEERKFERFIGAGHHFNCAVETIMEVAVGHAPEGGGFAPASVGFDVPAFEKHGGFLPFF